MVFGLRALAGLLLAVAMALAGCTNDDVPPARDGPAGTVDPNASARPSDVYLNDTGTIQGPFAKDWTLDVPNVAFASATLSFTLSGVQAASPPTARIDLTMEDPAGGVVRTASLGLGADANAVRWSLSPADLSAAGAYHLRAVTAADNPLPSAGLATYTLTASVLY